MTFGRSVLCAVSYTGFLPEVLGHWTEVRHVLGAYRPRDAVEADPGAG